MELKAILLSLAALPLVKTETVLGVYIFSRHGDRTPKALAPANLTSLGADEVYTSGSYYRNRYVASDATSPIFGLSRDIAALGQLAVSAPVDNVLQSSAQAFLQGLYPPAGHFSVQELANDSSIAAPLGGYQYIPVNTVSSASSSTNAENSAWLQGSSGCNNAVVSSNNYLASDDYITSYNQSKDFYTHLLPVINSTFGTNDANFKNAYTIFDYVNVATIHNKTIPASNLLTKQTLYELKLLANVHEWNLAYNSSDRIRAVAGATLAAEILQALNTTITRQGKVPLNIQFGAYGSFLSFFGLAQLPAVSADFTGVVDYAASMAFELVTNVTVGSGSNYPSPDDISVRFMFSNSSAANSAPAVYPLFGQTESLLPWSQFVSEMNKFAIGDTAAWCQACGNTTGMCATAFTSSNNGGDATTMAKSRNGMSLAVAGVIGALVTLSVVLGVEALIYAIAGLRLVRKSTLAAQPSFGTGAAATRAKA
ncbi:phosphoglycerate mutase-like protein [Xylariaceae sp. FL1651]|nr:phosphoglycerate mutase-like protein [Xylariaceae sp. FL1651]